MRFILGTTRREFSDDPRKIALSIYNCAVGFVRAGGTLTLAEYLDLEDVERAALSRARQALVIEQAIAKAKASTAAGVKELIEMVDPESQANFLMKVGESRNPGVAQEPLHQDYALSFKA